MTYEEIVATAKKEMAKCDTSDYRRNLAVEINIVGEGEGAFYIEFKDDVIDVQPYEYYDNDCKLIASAETLNKLIAGKLKVEGSVDKALEFQKLIGAKKSAKKKAKSKAKA